MRRLFLLGAVLAALAMLMTPALAGADDDDDGGGDAAFCAPAGPPDPGQCSVTGLLDNDFEANSGPLGENPTGSFYWERLPFFNAGDITCLQVIGNRAWIGGIVTDSNDVPVGRGFVFSVIDNGPAGSDLTTIGHQLLVPPTATTPNCGSPFTPTFPVNGDIVVQDNTAGGGDDDDDEDDEDEDEDEDDEDDDDDD